ncbi:hypothetical protein FORC81_p118 (plasmid) [Escherichia coli]|nr:hypothetical protein FORC81_p118 [Escherichia coli]UQB84990.1 hypothetical protein [Salmonella enterica subsp. enterica serovar Typhimurium]
MPAAIALDIILPHMSKSIFTEKLAANLALLQIVGGDKLIIPFC